MSGETMRGQKARVQWGVLSGKRASSYKAILKGRGGGGDVGVDVGDVLGKREDEDTFCV